MPLDDIQKAEAKRQMAHRDAEREGERIARAIFRVGNEAGSPCKRIQFMGGEWPDRERGQGGLCESSLATVIADCLRDPQRGI